MLGSGEIAQGLLFLYIPFVISTTFHEAAHALVAKLGGDDTAYRGGQVSLNPLPHIRREPFGMVVLPLLLLFTSGFLIGFASAPIDPYWATRHPKRAALVSLAGPLTNFLLAAIAFAVCMGMIRSDLNIQLGTSANTAFNIAYGFLQLNVVLGILNLLPLPPLDGAGVLEGFFPRTVSNVFAMLRSQPYIMFALMFVLIFYGGKLYRPALMAVDRWLGLR